jgi:hypothetical protein
MAAASVGAFGFDDFFFSFLVLTFSSSSSSPSAIL